MSAKTSSARKQVRNFVVIWIGVTLLMGACTFAAIYTAYGVLDESVAVAAAPTSVPTTVGGEDGVAAQTFPTRLPTEPPTSTPEVVAVEPTQVAAQPTNTAEPTDAPPTPTLLPVNDREFQLGIQVQVNFEGQQETWMNEVEKLNMNWIKQQVRWELMEPQEDQYDWAALDIGLSEASERDIKVLLSIVTAPDWAREPGVNLEEHGPPADPNDYAEFVVKILERYPNQVHAIEIWNEQNLDREWTSTRGLVPADYVELLRVTSQRIKEIDPGIVVVSGALSPTGLDNRVNAWDDFAYLQAMIDAGLLNYSDCIGAHHNGINIGPSVTWDNVPNDPTATYRGPFDNPHHSWSFRSTLQGYAIRVQQAGGDQKLCVTEFGWASTEDMDGTPPGFEFANDNTLEEQRDWTIEALNNMVEWDIVQIAILWNLNYGAQIGWDPNNDNVPYSIIGKDFNFRPVYDAVRDWMAEYRGLNT